MRKQRSAALASEDLPYPEISVVVPAYREEKYILATLLSLMRQTHRACEFILVVNGEPYGCKTQRICEEAGFSVIHEPRKGIALGRDIGLRAAKGRIVASYTRIYLRKKDEYNPSFHEIKVSITK